MSDKEKLPIPFTFQRRDKCMWCGESKEEIKRLQETVREAYDIINNIVLPHNIIDARDEWLSKHLDLGSVGLEKEG